MVLSLKMTGGRKVRHGVRWSKVYLSLIPETDGGFVEV